jgi:SAM-dependent methyltransferase
LSGVEKYLQQYDRDYFADYRDDGDPAKGKREQQYAAERGRILRLCSEGRILDIGCGLGGFLEGFADERWDKYGVEVSEYAKQIARAKGIQFDFAWTERYFDVVVFRGSLHHVDTPFTLIKQSIRSLKMGGLIVFLMTPNSDGIMYRLFRDIPGADEQLNFLLPSQRILRQSLTNFGCDILEFRFPYWDTPYANLPRDLLGFVLKCLGSKRRVSFWGNYLECYARRVREM